MIRRPPRSTRTDTLFPYTTLFRSAGELEVTSPEYGLARQIADRKDAIRQVNLVLFSERTLSEKIQALPDTEVAGVPVAHHIWDISRLHRQRSSRSHKEPLALDRSEEHTSELPSIMRISYDVFCLKQ